MDLNYCLCYSEENGLYMGTCCECKETIFRSYEKKGFVTTNVDIPNESIEIQIKSNFKYQGSSYLYATIRDKHSLVLDFSLDKLNILKYSSVRRHSVRTEDWKSLFQKIQEAYRFSRLGLKHLDAINYLNGLGQMLDLDEIQIKGTYHDEKPSIWKGEFLVKLYVADKIRDVIEAFDDSETDDNTVFETLIKLSCKFLKSVKRIGLKHGDNRNERIAQTIITVSRFLVEHGNSELFMSAYQEK